MINTDGIHLYALVIHWYALAVVISTWIGIETAARIAKRIGQPPEIAWRASLWVILGAIIGGRAWFVLFPPQSYTDNGITAAWMVANFLDLNQGAIAIWAGGLGLIGALVGGTLALYTFTRRRNLPFLVWADIGAVSLALTQAIARLGNALTLNYYGVPTMLPWGMLVDDRAQRVAPYTDLVHYPLESARFHPLGLYEFMLMIFVFGALAIFLLRLKPPKGDTALLYVILYGGTRFLLELIRANVSLVGTPLGIINISQLTALIAALGAVGVLLRRVRRERQQA